MGFTPSQINAMSLWEFMSCRDGWNASQGREPVSVASSDYSDAELRALGVEGF
ncbi:MAG: hypothetical protein AAF330_08150 [Pseudomonadota bacterium]